jgi:hypothetical protein
MRLYDFNLPVNFTSCYWLYYYVKKILTDDGAGLRNVLDEDVMNFIRVFLAYEFILNLRFN